MQYQKCKCCGRSLPRTRKFFIREVTENSDRLSNICKDCANQNRYNKEWKDGKLRCHCCNEFLDTSCFSIDNSRSELYLRNQYRYICKKYDYQRTVNRRNSLSDSDKLIKLLRERCLNAKLRAKSKNIYFDITKEDLLNLWDKQNGKCALTGLDMTYDRYKGRIYTNVSVDRIDSSKGYTKDNIQLVCMAANQAKSDLTDEELYEICKGIIDIYELKHTNND